MSGRTRVATPADDGFAGLPGRMLGPLWRQFFALSFFPVIVLVGRKVQRGDKPIAPCLRVLYAAMILAALIFVIRAFLRDRRRVTLWVLHVVARARLRPVLALYLAFWLVLGLLFAATIMVPGIGEGLETLWVGGRRDIATSTGDNSETVIGLLFLLLFATDIAALAAALAWLRWGAHARARRARRVASRN